MPRAPAALYVAVLTRMCQDERVRRHAVAYSLMLELLGRGAYEHLRPVSLYAIAENIGSAYGYIWHQLRSLEDLGYVELGLRRQHGRNKILVKVIQPPEENEAA